MELGTDRPSSMGGVMPIPGSVIRDYARYLDLDAVETSAFLAVIRAVDDHYRQHPKMRPDDGGSRKPSRAK